MEKDIFDFIDDDEDEGPAFNPDLVWNILTVVVLLVALCVGVLFLTVFINPNAGINPFPPSTLPATIALDTLTPTPKQLLPPTWTSVPPQATETLLPTETMVPPTAEVAPTDEQSEQASPTTPPDNGDSAGMPYVMYEGNPQYIPNVYHAELGCTWMGVGGQVLSLNGAPVTGIVMRLGGQLGDQPVDLVTVTGIATNYGPAGYEFDLTEIVAGPTASTGTLWVELLDQAGQSLSTQTYFDTFEDCDKSTIIIYFKQVQ